MEDAAKPMELDLGEVGVSQIRDTFLGVPTIRILVFGGLLLEIVRCSFRAWAERKGQIRRTLEQGCARKFIGFGV